MSNIFIIHGSYGNPDENWFPWLKVELEKLGHKVFVPKFPTPENQSLNSWKKVFSEYDGGNFHLYHSDNDPYIPTSESEKLSEKLGVVSVLVKGASHFNKNSGFDKFDLLLEDIKSELNTICEL